MRRIIPLIVGLALVALACACPISGGIQETIGAMQNTIGAALTQVPGMLTEVPGMLTELPATMPAEPAQPGFIRGHLSYPSEFLPAQRVIAFRVSTMEIEAEVTTEDGQEEYELSVAAGDYFVVAYLPDGTFSAGYSQAVPCGLTANCTDHSLIAVHVDAGQVVEGIDPQDWYAPEGTFPEMP
jgi:hypothetical protein